MPAQPSREQSPARRLGRRLRRGDSSGPRSVSSQREPRRKKQAVASSRRELRLESQAPRSETASSGDDQACSLKPWAGVDPEAPGRVRRKAWRQYKGELLPPTIPPETLQQLAERAAARLQRDVNRWRAGF